jgi:DNA-binding FrmR family transcriptional regulator
VGLLNDHVHHCVLDAVRRSAADGEEALDEVASTIRQVVRLCDPER